MKKTFSFDAETNGLWGTAFAISAVLRNEDGTTQEFVTRCPIEGEINGWVAENVLPQMTMISEDADNYREMLAKFIQFYMDNKDGADIIVHVGLPVEARLFIDAHNMGLLGDWDAPFPLIDVCTFPEVGLSVEDYLSNNRIEVPTLNGGRHNPLFDSWCTLLAYEHIMSTK